MKIEVGEYVRTNKGKIFIFAWLENSDEKRYTNKVLLGNGKIFENKFYYFDDGEEIVKHSKNIIDLVEVGDIVNNGYIYEIGNTEDGHKWVHNLNGLLLFENDIKTILTKEQYTRNCYTVERKE